MKILLTCINFKGMTGSELYFYDLAVALSKLGHDVSILSSMNGGFLHEKATKFKVKCYDFSQAPSTSFDIIIASHRPVIELLIKQKIYPNTPIISVNHSEVIPLEFPVIDERVVHYIAIREGIRDMLIKKYFIEEKDISVVYNPINTDKLLSVKQDKPERKTVVFPATIDHLRINAIEHIIKKSEEEDFDVVFVGQRNIDYTPKGKNVYFYPASWDIQRYYSKATHTAGILMGRTTIEGWFFGLPSYIYNIDKEGGILGVDLVDPPSKEELNRKFDYKSVAHQIIDIAKSEIAKNQIITN